MHDHQPAVEHLAHLDADASIRTRAAQLDPARNQADRVVTGDDTAVAHAEGVQDGAQVRGRLPTRELFVERPMIIVAARRD